MLTGAPLIAVFLVTMVILFVLLIKFKFSATIALVLASMILGIASGMPLTTLSNSINGGFWRDDDQSGIAAGVWRHLRIAPD